MNVTIEEAHAGHIGQILHTLREHDKPAFAAATDPARALREALRRASQSYAGLIDGGVVCLWGIEERTILLDAAYLWMVTSRLVEQHPLVFVRRSKMLAQQLLEVHGTIEGHVFGANEASIKWLRWLGARFEPADCLDGVFEFRLGGRA